MNINYDMKIRGITSIAKVVNLMTKKSGMTIKPIILNKFKL